MCWSRFCGSGSRPSSPRAASSAPPITRRWRCAPSTGISCARSGSSSSRWCISTDHDERPTEPRRDRPHAARRHDAGAGAVVRHVRRVLRSERPDQPGLQLEHPLPHGGAVHHRLHGRRRHVLHVSAGPRPSPGRHHRPRQGRAPPAPSGHGPGSPRRDAVSQAAIAEHDVGIEPAESPLTPESWGKLGMWVFLAADAMSFGGLLAGYGALRYGDPTWPIPSSVLGIQLTAFMTFLLICSSVTMVEALAGIRHGDRTRLVRFLLLTITGGMMFLGFQAFEWTKLIFNEGQSISRNNFGATFFILTGFHGCHVFGGVTYLSAVLGRAVRGTSGAIVIGLVGAGAALCLIALTS